MDQLDLALHCAGDRFSWFRDEEFARQVLAGVNPICIQLLTVAPPFPTTYTIHLRTTSLFDDVIPQKERIFARPVLVIL